MKNKNGVKKKKKKIIEYLIKKQQLEHLLVLEVKVGKSCEEVGIEIESCVVETDPLFDDLSSKSSHESLSFTGHSSKKRCMVLRVSPSLSISVSFTL